MNSKGSHRSQKLEKRNLGWKVASPWLLIDNAFFELFVSRSCSATGVQGPKDSSLYPRMETSDFYPGILEL